MAKSSVKLIDDSNEYCSEIDEAALDMRKLAIREREQSIVQIAIGITYWCFNNGSIIQELPNEYFLPNYFQEIKENKLGTVLLGTNLCLGILQRFNSNYKNEMPKAAKHTIFTKTLTSGEVVKLNLKRNIGLKQTISYFVKKSYQSLL